MYCKKINCKVDLCNIASVQHNYFWMITSKKCLKRMVNITFEKNYSNFIFTASFHRACVYLCLNFRTKKLSFWQQQVKHENISFILIVTRLFKSWCCRTSYKKLENVMKRIRRFGVLELRNRVTKTSYAKWHHTSSY